MHKSTFLKRLADPLARLPWHPHSLAQNLRQRLPIPFTHFAEPIAKELCLILKTPVAPRRDLIADELAEIPEVDLIWKHALKHNVWPGHSLTPSGFHPAHPFERLDLPPLTTTAALADWLGISADQLTRFADLRGLSNNTNNPFASHYNFHKIAKRSGKPRLIEEPKPLLKRLQRRILRGLLDKIPPSPHAHGFVANRSCIAAAAKHCGEPLVVSFDLRSFFTSITGVRVFGLLRSFGYPASVAWALTGLCTLRTPPHFLQTLGPTQDPRLTNRHLPQGAPTSPALANLCAFGLDRRLSGLARRLGATYTRYADDLSFSGDAHIGRPLLRIIPEIVADEGFALAPEKTRLMPAHHRQVVTGIVVNRHINLSRRDYDRLKAEIHTLPPNPPPDQMARLLGRIGWLDQLNPAKANKLRNRLSDRLSQP